MHKIHFEKLCIMICSPDEAVPGGPERLCFTVPDPEESYRRFCSAFKEVSAGGGLVSNGRGAFLMILRGGLWDLPKGHQDEGEDIRETALREVREETGAQGLEASGPICTTDHIYLRDGLWHLKHTRWYAMTCDAHAPLVPQTTEDITEAVWVAKENLESCLENTYPSIREVFDKAKL